MYSIVVKKYGGPEILEYIKTNSQKIDSKHVRIQVDFCGVNFADLLTIKGKYQERPRPPFSPGLEVSGKILEIGEEVSKHKVGDSVMAIMKFGGYQSEVVVPSENVYEIPSKMP